MQSRVTKQESHDVTSNDTAAQLDLEIDDELLELLVPDYARLSDEQRELISSVIAGRDVIVDATVGSGKTFAIQTLCSVLALERPHWSILYLTYNKLLKRDAQERVVGSNVYVQNYHGFVHLPLCKAEIKCSRDESVSIFNKRFDALARYVSRYDAIIIDEYQDINEDCAELLLNLKSKNPAMQVVMVGDVEQKVRSDTRLDARAFAKNEMCDNPKLLAFTQSFRICNDLASKLSIAWNKPITGVNASQKIKILDFNDAVSLMLKRDTKDILALGARNGAMSDALNALEQRNPDKFNKHTVYATIRDQDSRVQHDDTCAIFTTFDSSKGLERATCVVFGFDESYWSLRAGFDNVDYEILRNVFLVAASRGKDEIVFVRSNDSYPDNVLSSMIGGIDIRRFVNLPHDDHVTFDRVINAAEAFDFKFAENIREAYQLIDRDKLTAHDASVIDVETNDALIDLSPVIGKYQEFAFFNDSNPQSELAHAYETYNKDSVVTKEALKKISDKSHELTTWQKSLIVAGGMYDQRRYFTQVTHEIDEASDRLIRDRIATRLDTDDKCQIKTRLAGFALRRESGESTPITFAGVCDAIDANGVVFELKFVSELSHTMFLQLAMYLIMTGRESGVLWNVKTNEAYRVTIPDRRAFMDAVIKCVTKQHFDSFRLHNRCTTAKSNSNLPPLPSLPQKPTTT